MMSSDVSQPAQRVEMLFGAVPRSIRSEVGDYGYGSAKRNYKISGVHLKFGAFQCEDNFQHYHHVRDPRRCFARDSGACP
jgi:hypothetical protein